METRREPTKTRRNLAEPGGNLAETWWKKSKLKGGGWEYNFWHGLYSQPPPSTYFFSAGFRQVSARFRRVLPGSSARFRRVPLGSAATPGSTRFRWVPGFRQVSCARFCRVSANKVPAPAPPFNLLLGLRQVLAKRLPRLRGSGSFLLGPYAEGDGILIFIVQLFHIETCQHVPTFIALCIEHTCR